MEKLHLPKQHALLKTWLEENRGRAFDQSREWQKWKEWYCLSRWFEALPPDDDLSGGFAATWLDKTGSADFCLDGGDWRYALEVTEATRGDERRAIAKARHEARQLSFHKTGRFQNGASGNEPEKALVRDIRRAIKRKMKKSYAPNAILLIYPNSNVNPFAPDRRLVKSFWQQESIDHRFKRIFVVFDQKPLINLL